MPKPSVALCRPKPMISSRARLISPFAADWPMARPSEKLCRPMPTAMSSASLRPGLVNQPDAGASSSTAAAPGPYGRGVRFRPIQRS